VKRCSTFLPSRCIVGSWAFMISREHVAIILENVGYFSLFPATLGQAAILGSTVGDYLPTYAALAIVLPPWLLVFSLTYTKVFPVRPRTFRFSLILALCWHFIVSIGAEFFYQLGWTSGDGSDPFLVRVLMHLGWLFCSMLFQCIVTSSEWRCRKKRGRALDLTTHSWSSKYFSPPCRNPFYTRPLLERAWLELLRRNWCH
jgi:hypothetical protein